MEVGQIRRHAEVRRRKGTYKEIVTYDLCIGHEPVDPVIQRLTGNGQTVCNIIRSFRTRAEAEEYKKKIKLK